jgi:hypothetical protein
LLCSDPQLSNCAADSANIDVAKGTIQEIQEFVVGSSDFALELFGYSSPIFPKTEEIATIQQKLDEILPLGIILYLLNAPHVDHHLSHQARHFE